MSPVSTDTSSDNTKSLYNFKKLNNEGHNYSTWAIHCRMVLVGLGIWDVVNPASPSSVCPTPIPIPSSPSSSAKPQSSNPTPDPIAEWDRKNDHTLSQIFLSVDNTPLWIVNGKSTAREAWQALTNRYYGIGALDASILSSHLHRFLLDDTVTAGNELCHMSRLSRLCDGF